MKTKPYLAGLPLALAISLQLQAASTINFGASGYTVAENAGSVSLAVLRSGDPDTVVSVDFATADGTATNGLKYTAVSGTLPFGAGETNKIIVVPILNEGFVEGTKRFTVTLSNPTNAVVGTPAVATVSIADNDPGLQFESASYSVAEDAGFVLIGVLRGDDGTNVVTVDFATSNLTATNGLDYVATNGTFSFTAGEPVKLFTIPILNDGLKELSKYFRLTLSNPTNQVLGAQKTAQVAILDNDAGVQFQPYNQYWIAENEGALTLTVVRGNDGNLGPFTVDFATSDLTATNSKDYAATNGTLSFAQGEIVKTLTVPILYDAQTEVDEQFKVTLSNPTGGVVFGPNTNATVTILDTTGMAAHRFDGIAVLPDRSVQLSLGGGVHARFRDYFDLYRLEVSSNLVDWTPLVTLQRTNASTKVLAYTDTEATNGDRRFYRTPSDHFITPFFAKPTGPYAAGMVSRLLTDPSRRNRYGVSTNDSFMVSVWYPAVAQAGRWPALFEHPQLARDPTVPAGSWAAFMDRLPYLVTYALPDLPCATRNAPYPIVLYSPGSTGDHAHASERGPYLASYGYVVVGLEHYDTFATVFPDGTQLRGVSDMSTAGLQDRVRDMVFALDELARWNTNDPVFAGRLNLTKVAAMGVSYGGGTVAEFGRTESRCKAVIALDPASLGAQQLEVPLLEITTPEIGDSSLYAQARKEAIWFQLNGAAHQQGGTDFYWAIFTDPTSLAFSREAARTMIAYELWFLNKQLKSEVGPPLPLPGFPLVTGFKQK